MKKIGLLILSAYLLLFFGCNKDEQGGLQGTVKDASELASFVDVLIFKDGVIHAETVTDEAGVFEIEKLDVGDYIVQAHTIKILGQTVNNVYSDKQAIAITAGNISNIEINLKSKLCIEGLVLDNDNNPYPLVNIQLFTENGLNYLDKAVSDVDGKFEFYDLDAGIYLLKLITDNETKEVKVNYTDELRKVSISFETAAFKTLYGHVISNQFDPIEGATIHLFQYGLELASTSTSASGTFSFSGLSYGALTLSATKSGYNDANLDISENWWDVDNYNAIIEMTEEAPTSNILGTVKDAFGTAISSATINLIQNGNILQTVYSGTSGEFTISGVRDGSYQVAASKSGFHTTTVDITHTENIDYQANPVNLVLTVQKYATGAFIKTLGVNTVSTEEATFYTDVIVLDRDGAYLNDGQINSFAINQNISDGITYTFTFENATTGTTYSGAANYSVNLLIDQSGSITSTDPYDLRVQASKEFLSLVENTGSDWVSLASFASTLTYYNNSTFTKDGSSLFSDVDGLAGNEGGSTYLYQSMDNVVDFTRDFVTNSAPATDPFVIVFTDGQNNGPGTVETSITNAQNKGVKIVTVGLSTGTNQAELTKLAAETDGLFFWAREATQLASSFTKIGDILKGNANVIRIQWTVNTTPAAFNVNRSITSIINIETNQGDLVEIPFTVNINAMKFNTDEILPVHLYPYYPIAE